MLIVSEYLKDNYIIDGIKYTPKMPKHWHAIPMRGLYDDMFTFRLRRTAKLTCPITGEVGIFSLFKGKNFKAIIFTNYYVFYTPILKIVETPSYILANGKVVSYEEGVAIVNWQIHNRCFNYMECPFVNN